MNELREKVPRKKKPSSGRRSQSAIYAREVFIVAIFILAQSLFYYSDFFKLKTIRVYGNNKVSESEIISAANIPMGQNVITLPLEEFRTKLEKIYWIKDTKLKRNVPGIVDIYVEERVPFILVRQSKELFELKELSRSSPSPIPSGEETPSPSPSPTSTFTSSPGPTLSPVPKESSPSPVNLEDSIKKLAPWFAADLEGVVLYEAPEDEYTKYPRMVIENNIVIGKKIPFKKIETIQELEKWLSVNLKNEVIQYSVDDRQNAIVFAIHNGKPLVIKLGKIENMNNKMELLAHFLEIIDEKALDVEYLDIRYKVPVMKLVRQHETSEKDEGKKKQKK